jgi:hypothetical protein
MAQYRKTAKNAPTVVFTGGDTVYAGEGKSDGQRLSGTRRY